MTKWMRAAWLSPKSTYQAADLDRHPRASTEVTAVAAGNPADPQSLVLVDCLLRGMPAAEALTASGVADDSDSRRLVEEVCSLASHPVVAFAKVTATRLRCRDWLLNAYASLMAGESDRVLDERDAIPSVSEFFEKYYWRNRAVLIRGAGAAWPALKLWTPTYLKQTCGSAVVDVMRNRASASIQFQNTGLALRQTMRFDEYVDLVYATEHSNDFYIVSRNRFFDNPSTKVLLGDIEALPFINKDLSDGDVRMWFGPRGTVTKLHHDDRNNVIVQVLGRKVVRLYPAHAAPLMNQTMPWYAAMDPQEIQENMSTPQAITVKIGPGDALFIPVGWWHSLVALDPSVTLAFINFGVPNEYGAP